MTKTTQNWKIGDSAVLMQEMEPDSVDLIVTDPPYGYSFMGKDWDKAVPTVDIWQEALRVLKPGAFAFIMSAPRQDVLAHNLVNLSDAGFNTGFTSIYWTYASGFPKAGNVGKMVDKRLGAERDVIGKSNRHGGGINHVYGIGMGDGNIPCITAPATTQAKALDGSYGGFQPKPAVEVIMVVMKPLSESTYVDQALANGKGITWLDDGRIPYQNEKNSTVERYKSDSNDKSDIYGKYNTRKAQEIEPQGRFPANLLTSDDILNDGEERKATVDRNIYTGTTSSRFAKTHERFSRGDSGSFSRYFDLDAWFDTKFLPKEAQKTFPFLITPKASKREKKGSKHPTTKPVKLFTYLMTIGSRVGDMVLDPFLGSGTALEAGRLTNRDVMGFELDPQWEKHYADRAMKNTLSLDGFL